MSVATPRVTVAVGHRYDSRYLRNGVVPVDGFEVDYPAIPSREKGIERLAAPGEPYMAPGPIFAAMAADPPYDMGEQAFSTYVQAVDLGRDVTAVPVFPSRFFPHVQVCVRADSRIETPRDLEGKRFALSCFSVNFGIWLRGVLEEQYGVQTDRITWVVQRDEYFGWTPPERFTVERAPRGESMWSLLKANKIDALTTPWGGAQAKERSLKLLFEVPYKEIAEYHARAGIFPINTVLMMPGRTARAHPALLRRIFRAYEQALDLYERDVRTRALDNDEYGGISLFDLEQATGVFLPRHGLEENRPCIEAMIRHCYDQNIIGRRLEPEDLFLSVNVSEKLTTER
jgi:4,5-dihydroxyphthalate decarboxylase